MAVLMILPYIGTECHQLCSSSKDREATGLPGAGWKLLLSAVSSPVPLQPGTAQCWDPSGVMLCPTALENKFSFSLASAHPILALVQPGITSTCTETEPNLFCATAALPILPQAALPSVLHQSPFLESMYPKPMSCSTTLLHLRGLP